jgi:hypothetical protein
VAYWLGSELTEYITKRIVQNVTVFEDYTPENVVHSDKAFIRAGWRFASGNNDEKYPGLLEFCRQRPGFMVQRRRPFTADDLKGAKRGLRSARARPTPPAMSPPDVPPAKAGFIGKVKVTKHKVGTFDWFETAKLMLASARNGDLVPETTISKIKAQQPMIGGTELTSGAYRLSRSQQLRRWLARAYLDIASWYDNCPCIESVIVGEIIPVRQLRDEDDDHRAPGDLHCKVKRKANILLARLVNRSRLLIHDVFYEASVLGELKALFPVHRPSVSNEVMATAIRGLALLNLDQEYADRVRTGSIEMYRHWRQVEQARLDFLAGPGHSE